VAVSRCYECDTSVPEVTAFSCNDPDALIALMSSHLGAGFRFVTAATDQTGTVMTDETPIHNGLLGGISEYMSYVLAVNEQVAQFPFIHCFKAANPVIVVTFPLVDIGIFLVGATDAADKLCIQEVKATRENEQYFGEVLDDFETLYSKSRLSSKAEELKFQLRHAGHDALIPRLNACLGTCPADSSKIKLIPTGVSGTSTTTQACTNKLSNIVAALKNKGWQFTEAIYVRVHNIDVTYKRFARGEGRASA